MDCALVIPDYHAHTDHFHIIPGLGIIKRKLNRAKRAVKLSYIQAGKRK